MSENPNATAPGDAKKQCAQAKEDDLQKVLPRSDIGLHLLCVYHKEKTRCAHSDKRHPI
jgi:hypothetical protein